MVIHGGHGLGDMKGKIVFSFMSIILLRRGHAGGRLCSSSSKSNDSRSVFVESIFGVGVCDER